MNPAMTEAINSRTEAVTLRQLELVLQQFAVTSTIQQWSIRPHFEQEINAAVVTLVHSVYGVSKPITKSVSWPKTWWDAFKIRFFPGWLLRRFPAKFARETLTATAYSLLPELEQQPQYKVLNIVLAKGIGNGY